MTSKTPTTKRVRERVGADPRLAKPLTGNTGRLIVKGDVDLKSLTPTTTSDLLTQLEAQQNETSERISVLKDRLSMVLGPESLSDCSDCLKDTETSPLDTILRRMIDNEEGLTEQVNNLIRRITL